MLSGAYASNTAFLFVSLKPWEERKAKEEHGLRAHRAAQRPARRGVPEAASFAFGRRPSPASARARGYTLVLQDRSGNTPRGARGSGAEIRGGGPQAPEIGTANTVFRAAVPQIFARHRRDKVLKLGVDDLRREHDARQRFLGGTYVNDFNRFGRVYRVYLQAEPEYRTDPASSGSSTCATSRGGDGAARHAGHTRPIAGPEFTNRFNLYRSAEVTGVPRRGYSSGQAMAALEEVAEAGPPPGHRLRVVEHVLPGEEGGRDGGAARASRSRAVRLPHPGGPVRELVAAR